MGNQNNPSRMPLSSMKQVAPRQRDAPLERVVSSPNDPSISALSSPARGEEAPHNNLPQNSNNPVESPHFMAEQPETVSLQGMSRGHAPANTLEDVNALAIIVWNLSQECHRLHMTVQYLEAISKRLSTSFNGHSEHSSSSASYPPSTSREFQFVPNTNQFDPNQTEDEIQSDDDPPTRPMMNQKNPEQKKPDHPKKEVKFLPHPAKYFPDSLESEDRLSPHTMATSKPAAKNRQMNNQSSAGVFQAKREEVKSRSKPAPSRLRVEGDPEIQKKRKEMDRIIGFPKGPPEDQPGLMDTYLQRSVDYIQVETRLRNRWPQQEAAEREVERMRRGVIPSSDVESPDTIKRRERAEKRSESRLHHSRNRAQSNTQLGSPIDEGDPDPTLDNTMQQANSQMTQRSTASPLPRSAIFAFNGTLEKPQDPRGSPQAQDANNPAESEAKNARKKGRQPDSDNKALGSNLGDYWAPRVDERGGRPKKKPRNDVLG
ncbi:hypothetical protein SCARD494_00943 [Seiridium cardinale]